MTYAAVVVFGGVSNENEISVLTGIMVCNLLKKGGNRVYPVYIATDGTFYGGDSLADIRTYENSGYALAPKVVFGQGGVWVCGKHGKPKKWTACDVVINCCHGGAGEGGGLSGLCAMLGLPLVGAGTFEGATFLDKYYTKLVLKSLEVPTVPYVVVKSVEACLNVENVLAFPVIVKPLTLGSSIGIEIANNLAELRFAVESVLCLDNAAIVESYIFPHREINCAACFVHGGVKVSACEEAVYENTFLSFSDKYQGGGKSVCPADLPPEVTTRLQETTKRVYTALKMRGIVRFDYLVTESGFYITEVNTTPGSLGYYLFKENDNVFRTFYNLLVALMEEALCEQKKAKEKRILHTGILKNYPLNGCKKGSK